MKETLYLKKNIQKSPICVFFRDSSSRIDSRTKIQSSIIQQSSCHSWRYSAMPLFKRQTCQISRSFIEMV